MIYLLLVSCLCIHVTCGDYRLPGDVTPQHYDVRVIYDIDPSTNYSYYGVVDIVIKILKPTSKITLHAQDFTILARKITLVGVSDYVAVNKVSHTDGYDFLTLELQENLVVDENYTLSMPFYGNVEPRQDGVFVRSYVEKEYQKQYILATHFEPISARRAFPCFDEPLYKATFRLTIGHHKDYTAVSNMPVDKTMEEMSMKPYWPADIFESTFNKDKWNFVYDKFKKTPRMSTYLIAYVISKFKYQASSDNTRRHFRTWARSELLPQMTSSTTGPKILFHFEKWYNTSYPLPKLDVFAIPDFPAPSMANWGLIIYDEANVLSDKYYSTSVHKERVDKMLSHELAHQWFGDLVTMNWWSDLWLKEGLARFMESVGVAADTQWKGEAGLAVENIVPVLDLDALDTSHPLSVSIEDPKRLNEIFDQFAYCKGASLVRMLFIVLGEKVFRRTLHDYLNKYAYSNADTDDLWQQFSDTIEGNVMPRNLTVKHIMDTWTRQAGYPVLTVERDYATNTVNITQKRHMTLDTQSPSPASWWVPISITSQHTTPNPTLHWLEDLESNAVQRFHHGAGPDDWILLNYDMIAPYRVIYDTQNWQILTNTLKSMEYNSIPPLGRVQLLSDALELAWTGRLDYNIALDLASYLQREKDYLPLKVGYELLTKIDNVLKRDPDYYEFQRYMRRLVADTFWSVGGIAAKKIFNQDDLGKVKLQMFVSEWACSAKTSGCEENAIEMFDSWMKVKNPDEDNPIPADLRSTVYCAAISRGSVRHWRFLYARVQNKGADGVREVVLKALACTREVWLLHQYLERTIAEYSSLSSHEAAYIISGVVTNTVGYTVAKEFIYEKISDIYNVASIKGPDMGLIIQALLSQFSSQQELDEFVVWSERHNDYLSDCVLAVERGVEKARTNIMWLARNSRAFISKVNFTINEITVYGKI